MLRRITISALALSLSACAAEKPTEVVALGPNAPACPIDVPANASDEEVVNLLLAKRPDLASDVQGFATLITACGGTVQVQRVNLG